MLHEKEKKNQQQHNTTFSIVHIPFVVYMYRINVYNILHGIIKQMHQNERQFNIQSDHFVKATGIDCCSFCSTLKSVINSIV